MAGTTLVAALTQWRGEVQRTKDREAEAQRSREDREHEIKRWERERSAAREDERRAHWETERRAAYEAFIWAVLNWREAIIRARVEAELGVAPRRSPPKEEEAYAAEARLVLLASYELRDAARRVIARQQEASHAVTNPELDDAARIKVLADSEPALLVFIEMARVEMGVVGADDFERVRARLSNDRSGSP